MKTDAHTALMASQADHRLRAAMDRLLYRLRQFMSAYPIHEDDKMPEHGIGWVAAVGEGGPDQTILEAIKMHPELWVHAIPAECCIVDRRTLKNFLSDDAVEYLEGVGMNNVSNQAARLLYEAEERERRERGRG